MATVNIAHKPNIFKRIWNSLGEVDNPEAEDVLNELPEEDRKILNEASESVKFEQITVNAVGITSNKKVNINKNGNEQQKVQNHEEKDENKDESDRIR